MKTPGSARVKSANKTSYQEIETLFGTEVCEIVRACTDAETLPKPPWEERKKASIAALSHKSDTIKLVVACDKLHNAECIVRDVKIHGPETWQRFNATPAQILWYYESIVGAIRDMSSPVVGILGEKVRELRSSSGYPVI